jgi:hypothetical protein
VAAKVRQRLTKINKPPFSSDCVLPVELCVRLLPFTVVFSTAGGIVVSLLFRILAYLRLLSQIGNERHRGGGFFDFPT